MGDLWQTIAEMAAELHPEHIEALSEKIAKIQSPMSFDDSKIAIATGIKENSIHSFGKTWKENPSISSRELAAALRCASVTAEYVEKLEKIDMVWTGPSTGLVPSRRTEQVLLEVISMAKRNLFLVSFIAYDIDDIMMALQDAIERNVRLHILLESSKEHGGKVDIDSIETFSAKVPAANIYVWHPEEKGQNRWSGTVHAKCAVADGCLAFITSANLTGAAMERNMELGVLVRGGNLPDRLARHLEALIKTDIIKKV